MDGAPSAVWMEHNSNERGRGQHAQRNVRRASRDALNHTEYTCKKRFSTNAIPHHNIHIHLSSIVSLFPFGLLFIYVVARKSHQRRPSGAASDYWSYSQSWGCETYTRIGLRLLFFICKYIMGRPVMPIY